MKLKIGVIGCGHLGRLHVKMHTMIENSELVGIFDVDNEKAQKVADEFSTKAYNNLDKLIHDCDGLIIVTSTSAHHDVAMKCLEKSKHVFIEKPITKTVEEAQELINKAEEKNVILQVGHIERYNPALNAVKDIEIAPKFIECHRLAQFNPRGTDVAVVLDLMIHDIDIILHLIDSPVEHIEASGVSVISGNIDIANARLRFKNGAVANVTASRISLKKMRKFRVFQKNGYLSLDFDNGTAEIFSLSDKDKPVERGMSVTEIGNKKVIYDTRPKVEINALLEENRDFVNSVLENKPVSITGADGMRALRVATEIVEMIHKAIDEQEN